MLLARPWGGIHSSGTAQSSTAVTDQSRRLSVTNPDIGTDRLIDCSPRRPSSNAHRLIRPVDNYAASDVKAAHHGKLIRAEPRDQLGTGASPAKQLQVMRRHRLGAGLHHTASPGGAARRVGLAALHGAASPGRTARRVTPTERCCWWRSALLPPDSALGADST